jgi:hypothetical protein
MWGFDRVGGRLFFQNRDATQPGSDTSHQCSRRRRRPHESAPAIVIWKWRPVSTHAHTQRHTTTHRPFHRSIDRVAVNSPFFCASLTEPNIPSPSFFSIPIRPGHASIPRRAVLRQQRRGHGDIGGGPDRDQTEQDMASSMDACAIKSQALQLLSAGAIPEL